MKFLNNIFTLSIVLFAVGCNSLIMKDDKNIELYDDELIKEIQNTTNKTEIGYNDLPINIISTLENSYNNKLFLSELKAFELGYELTYTDVDTDEDFFKKLYFNIEGRKLTSKKDYNKRDKKCFELEYPIIFIMPDESNITISNNDDWGELKNWYNINEDIEQRPSLQYPVNIIYENGNTETIINEEEMIEVKNSCIDCMELVYPVTFILPDETTITVDNNSEDSWEELKNWYNENPNIEFDWNLQYPVNIQLEDGTITTANNLSDIELAKQNCE